jgi:RNA polymerase sigma-70 factor (ECF subfamily)
MDELTAALSNDLDGAFPRLVDGHADRLYTIALRVLGNPHDAEEVTQDALVRAYRALAGYDPQRVAAIDLRPWLTTVVLNVARNRTRRRRQEVSLDRSQAAGWAGPTAGAGDRASTDDLRPDRVALEREEAARLAAALAQLPPRYRIPVVLRHVDDMSYAEIADVLDRPQGTLKAQVHRGLAMLRTALTDQPAGELAPSHGGVK